MGTSYTRKARTIRIPPVTDTQVNAFSTGQIQTRGSYIYNGTVLQYPDGTPYVTQRPAFLVFNSPSDSGITATKGRGLYYWAGHSVDDLYFVNDNTIYKGSYANPIGTITTGHHRIDIAELNGVLVFLDKQNGQMWYIDSTDSETLVAMQPAGTDFTSLPQNNSQTLMHGIEVLDQTMYVLSEKGQIWGCTNVADAKVWNDALNVITAEKEDDFGVALSKHYDHLVVFGKRTIEFFYDAKNPTGSPLGVRQDISHNIGCADAHSVWRHGDEIYFLGINPSGQIQPYVLRDFQPVPIGNTSGISYLTTTKSLTNIRMIGSGMSSGGVIYYILTIYTLDSNNNINPSASYVYNSTSQIWTEWEFSGTNINNFPLINYTITDDSRIGEGIMADGTLVYANDEYVPSDTTKIDTADYVDTAYVATDYVETGGVGSVETIIMKIRLDNFDNDNRDWKFAHQLRFVGDETVNSNDLTVRWNDGNNVATGDRYTGTRTIDLSNNLNKLTRLGRFKSRSFEFEYSGNEQIRFEGIDLDVTDGTH